MGFVCEKSLHECVTINFGFFSNRTYARNAEPNRIESNGSIRIYFVFYLFVYSRVTISIKSKNSIDDLSKGDK